MSSTKLCLEKLESEDAQEVSFNFATAIKDLAAVNSSVGTAPFQNGTEATTNIRSWCKFAQEQLGLTNADVEPLVHSICAISHYSSRVHPGTERKTVVLEATDKVTMASYVTASPRLELKVPNTDQAHGRFIIDFLLNCGLFMMCSQTPSQKEEQFTTCSFKIKAQNSPTFTDILSFSWFVPGDKKGSRTNGFFVGSSQQNKFVTALLTELNKLEKKEKYHTQKLLSNWCYTFIIACLMQDKPGNVYLIQLGKFCIEVHTSLDVISFCLKLDISWNSAAWEAKLDWPSILPKRGEKRKNYEPGSLFDPTPNSGNPAVASSSASSSQTPSITPASKPQKKKKKSSQSVYEKVKLSEVMDNMSKLTDEPARSLLYCGSEIATEVMDYYSKDCTMTRAYMEELRKIVPDDGEFLRYCEYLAAKIVFLELNESKGTIFGTPLFLEGIQDNTGDQNGKNKSLLRIVLFSQNDQFLQAGEQGKDDRDRQRLFIRDQGSYYAVVRDMSTWINADLGGFTNPDENTALVFPSSNMLSSDDPATTEASFFLKPHNSQH